MHFWAIRIEAICLDSRFLGFLGGSSDFEITVFLTMSLECSHEHSLKNKINSFTRTKSSVINVKIEPVVGLG